MASKGYALPDDREDVWLPEGPVDPKGGATARPSRIPAELSDTAWFTDRALTYLKGAQGPPWFLHLGYYRPHPPFVAPAPYNTMYDPADVPPPVRAASPEAEAAQHPVMAHYVGASQQSKFFQDGTGRSCDMSEAEVRQMRATYFGLMSEIDAHLGRVLREAIDAPELAWHRLETPAAAGLGGPALQRAQCENVAYIEGLTQPASSP